MKEQGKGKADLTKIYLECDTFGRQPMSRCRDRCVDKCHAYTDMEISLETAYGIRKGLRRRAWWSARNRAEEQDKEIELAYEQRCTELWEMGAR